MVYTKFLINNVLENSKGNKYKTGMQKRTTIIFLLDLHLLEYAQHTKKKSNVQFPSIEYTIDCWTGARERAATFFLSLSLWQTHFYLINIAPSISVYIATLAQLCHCKESIIKLK